MKMTKRNYLILFLLALIFAAPGLTAYLSYRHPQWFLVNTTNKGELLNPPLLFSVIAQSKPKWRLIYWYPNACEAACLRQVDKLARIRLALGRHLYEVDEWLILAKESQQADETMEKTLREQDIHIMPISSAIVASIPVFTKKPQIFIANSEGYLVLAYKENAKPQDIYQDLKQLLKKSG
ncbi:MAG: hypothetical protein H0T84_14110 [Tatlockia sp.]|nr:hypothetical protein [Tatlockia sp.]